VRWDKGAGQALQRGLRSVTISYRIHFGKHVFRSGMNALTQECVGD